MYLKFDLQISIFYTFQSQMIQIHTVSPNHSPKKIADMRFIWQKSTVSLGYTALCVSVLLVPIQILGGSVASDPYILQSVIFTLFFSFQVNK